VAGVIDHPLERLEPIFGLAGIDINTHDDRCAACSTQIQSREQAAFPRFSL
jgi:hypothetical protein